MAHALAFAGTLFVLWLLLSGMFKGLLITLGVLSALFVMRIALRMDVVDDEGYPISLHPLRALSYTGWLIKEVVKSNIDVVRRIWSPHMRISPTVVKIRSSQRTKFGQVLFANCITLTPGTVSINLWDEEIRVHALTREAADELSRGEMDARVTKLEMR